MGIPLSVDKMRQVVQAYQETGSLRLAARKLGIAASTAEDRFRKANERGITANQTSAKSKASNVANLAKELLAARPKTWFDNLAQDEQTAMRQIKKDHLGARHRISVREIFDRCRSAVSRLTVSYERFRKWIDNADTQDPTE